MDLAKLCSCFAVSCSRALSHSPVNLIISCSRLGLVRRQSNVCNAVVVFSPIFSFLLLSLFFFLTFFVLLLSLSVLSSLSWLFSSSSSFSISRSLFCPLLSYGIIFVPQSLVKCHLCPAVSRAQEKKDTYSGDTFNEGPASYHVLHPLFPPACSSTLPLPPSSSFIYLSSLSSLLPLVWCLPAFSLAPVTSGSEWQAS